MLKDFVNNLREEFWAELSMKTGWGKEELKLVFERAVSNTLARMIKEERKQ